MTSMASAELRQRVLRHAGARAATPGETRTYDVRSIEGDPTAAPVVITITVPAACPGVIGKTPGEHRITGMGLEIVEVARAVRCGVARGEPTERVLHDSHTGTDYRITVPERHPCGHLTLHGDLIAEDAAFRMRETA